MSEVPLPFREGWRPAVIAGTKTTTVRTRRYGEAGDVFRVDGRLFKLLEVAQMPLGRARDLHWESEGFLSRREFEAHWTEEHPTRGFRESDSVWVHRFAFLENLPS